MKYSEAFALLDEIDAEVEQAAAEIMHEIVPDIERRSHVRAFDDLA